MTDFGGWAAEKHQLCLRRADSGQMGPCDKGPFTLEVGMLRCLAMLMLFSTSAGAASTSAGILNGYSLIWTTFSE